MENKKIAVRIFDSGVNIIAVLKIVRGFTGLGLKESKDIVDAPNSTIYVGDDLNVATKIKEELEQAGANVLINDVAEGEIITTQNTSTTSSDNFHSLNSKTNGNNPYIFIIFLLIIIIIYLLTK